MTLRHRGLVFAFVFCVFFFYAQSAYAASLPTGIFNLIMRSDGLCMDVYANQPVSGQNIDNWHCNGTTAQTFRAEALGGDVYRVINTNSGMCVDVYGNDTSEGADVVQAYCNGSSAQSFHVTDAGSGYVYLVNTNSGKCVGFGGTFQWQNTDQGNWQWVPDVRMYSCNGAADRQWLPVSPASCSVSLNPNPKDYAASATLSWSSSQAHYSVYINNVGYVGSSGSTSVAPTSNTDYSCIANGYGGSDGWHNYTLTVNPPANCTFNGSTVNHGSSVTAYQQPSVPNNQTCNSQTRTCTNGSLSGNYNHPSCTVSNPPPTCSLSLNPTSITQGQSSTLSWSSTDATSCTGSNFSTGSGSPTSGSTSVFPSQTTTYTASCTKGNDTVQCTGTGSGGIGAALTVSCTPVTSYSCPTISTIVQTATSSACAVTVTNPYATCTSPSFCSTGSATCLYEAVTGNISAIPHFVPSGDSATISWSTTNAVSCTVTGNGNTWTGTSGSQTSNPITEYTTYTIRCDDGDTDTTEDDFTDSVSVFRVPSWFEI